MLVTIDSLKNHQEKVAIVGLGYVGLPLAVALAKHFSVIGVDIKESRITDLKSGLDTTGELSAEALKAVRIEYASDPQKLREAKVFILALPTPVDEGNLPDLSLVEKATAMVGKHLTSGSVVVYESTVYPGVTEEICVPILEKESGLKCGQDFKVGYSPERINPGDKEHTIERITKVIAGQDAETLELLAGVYGAMTNVFKASSIKVAEAAKVIENTQRDLNIALMNELAIIFNKMNISTYDVLAAAGTKWNFLKFSPGLVGGHCIGVDPYYLTHKAQMLGYQPEVILAGRRINDGMGKWMVSQIIKKVVQQGKDIQKMNILIYGITFKENVPDVRNSKVMDIYREFLEYGVKPVVCDPLASVEEVKKEYGIDLKPWNHQTPLDVVILAVPHRELREEFEDIKKHLAPRALIVDIKHVFSENDFTGTDQVYWTL
jgi:UDP-N-acetyl-D-galactosamine dehydrogenase